jgi:hypothetical protein
VKGALATLAGAGSWLRGRLLEPELPLVVVELRRRSVGVVRLARSGAGVGLGGAAWSELPAGALEPSIAGPNVMEPAAVTAALRAALERAGALGASRVGLVLPDPAARLALLPAAEVAARSERERIELARFRLKRAVPFEVREARLALAAAAAGQVLVGAALRSVLEAYEAPLGALGLHPGLVEVQSLALLSALARRGAPGDRLLVNWDEEYLSLIVARDGLPLLVRTLVGAASASAEQAPREVASTLLYYRERLSGPGLAAAAVRVAGRPFEAAAALLAPPLGLAPQPLDPWRELGVADFAGASQLAGAAACALRRAA